MMETIEKVQINFSPKIKMNGYAREDVILHIFCPEYCMKQVSLLLKDKKIKFDLNNRIEYERESHHQYLHFSSRSLGKEDKEFLIQRIKLGYYVRPLVDFLDDCFKYTFIELLNSDYFLHRLSFSSLRAKQLWFIKRVVDISIAIVLLLLTLPLMLLVAFLIRISSQGTIFYTQERVGKFNRKFKIIKFRSMKVNAEKDGVKWAELNDSRITTVGRFMRLLRIDELPQLYNVIKGDMSLVGPRPEREFFVTELEKEISYYRFRHAVKPGLTGWAQVNYPYGSSVEDAKWKHRYDIYYIKHQTFLFDIKILLKTIFVVIFRKGR